MLLSKESSEREDASAQSVPWLRGKWHWQAPPWSTVGSVLTTAGTGTLRIMSRRGAGFQLPTVTSSPHASTAAHF